MFFKSAEPESPLVRPTKENKILNFSCGLATGRTGLAESKNAASVMPFRISNNLSTAYKDVWEEKCFRNNIWNASCFERSTLGHAHFIPASLSLHTTPWYHWVWLFRRQHVYNSQTLYTSTALHCPQQGLRLFAYYIYMKLHIQGLTWSVKSYIVIEATSYICYTHITQTFLYFSVCNKA